MLLNLFTKKPFSPKDPTSSSHEIFCTPEEKDALKKIRPGILTEKKDEARNCSVITNSSIKSLP